MLVAVREKVAALKRQGRPLEDTIAAKPTAAFDPEWGQWIVVAAQFTRLAYAGV